MRGLKFLILFICLSLLNAAQDLSKYPFIKSELNHLYFGKDSSSFLHLFAKMDSFKLKTRKQITVAHIGGSHVQGGTWSSAFMNNMQTELKSVGGGYFIFPYKLAKTNSPPFATSFTNGTWKKCRCVGKDFCLPLGMSGMSVTSNDSANNFGIALTKRAYFKGYNSIRVYHNFNSSFEFNISARHNLQAVRIDKKESGYTQFDLEMPVDSLSFELVKKDSLQKDFVLYGFSLESNLANVLYLASLGANGAASGSFLRCNYFSEQLKTVMPDMVIISLGVNDTQAKNFEKDDYFEHYDSLITQIKNINPNVAILLTTTTDNYIRRKTPNKRTLKTHEAMFELIQKHNIAVWDQFEIMGGYKSMLKWTKAGLAARDKVHFSPKGYTIMGDLMFAAFIKSYQNNQKK